MQFTTAIYNRVRHVTGDIWPNVECIILTGGGVALIDDMSWPDWARTTKLNIYANVRGQYLSLNGLRNSEKEAVA